MLTAANLIEKVVDTAVGLAYAVSHERANAAPVPMGLFPHQTAQYTNTLQAR